MLVAISGAQGCGKSTVLESIAKLGYPVIQRKTSRSILTDWGVTLDEVNDSLELSTKFQTEILTRKLADEADAAASSQIWFGERTAADLFVYSLINMGKFNEQSEWLDQYYQRCVEAQRSYHKVFYIKSGFFSVVNDGVRGANRHYSKMVDMSLEYYTRETVDPNRLHIIDVPDVESRVNFILSHI